MEKEEEEAEDTGGYTGYSLRRYGLQSEERTVR